MSVSTSTKGNFYTDTCFLARADPGAITYLVGEARQLHEQWRVSDSRPLVLWPDQCQLVLDMVSDPNVAAMIIDRNAIVLWCNENVAAWMSRTPQQCLGRCLWDISTGGDPAERLLALDRIMESGRPATRLERSSKGFLAQNYVIPLCGTETSCAVILARPVSMARIFGEVFGPGGSEKPGG